MSHTNAELKEAIIEILSSSETPLLVREITQRLAPARGIPPTKEQIIGCLHSPQMRGEVAHLARNEESPFGCRSALDGGVLYAKY
jgi:hypothetical protein